MNDPFAVIADHLGITPAELGEMSRDQIAGLRVSVRAQLDQTEAAACDLRNQLIQGEQQ